MRKAALLILFLIFPFLLFSQEEGQNRAASGIEKVLNYKVTMNVDTLGQVEVSEIIKLNVTGQKVKNGITRSFLKWRTTTGRRYENSTVEIISIERNGKQELYSVEDSEKRMTVRTKNPNGNLSIGIHEFQIRYLIKDVINYSNYTGNTLNWEFVDDQLNLPIDSFLGTLTFPETIEVRSARLSVLEGGKNKFTNHKSTIEGRTVKFDRNNLLPGQSIRAKSFFNAGFYLFPESLLTTEKILHFHSDIKVLKNGDLIVTEIFDVNVLGKDIKRGIIRSFPRKEYNENREVRMNYKIISVTWDGKKEKYKKERNKGWLEVRMGRKNQFIPHGVHRYQIKYKVSKIIDYYDDFDELYWNVNGNDWRFSTNRISAKVTLPEGAKIKQFSCYVGRYGSVKEDCLSRINGNQIEWVAVGARYREGMTVAVGFEKGIMNHSEILSKYWPVFILLPFLLGFIVFAYKQWSKYGIDLPTKTVVPQYFIAKELSTVDVGILEEERYDKRFLTASLVSLAVKGYIKVEELSRKKFKLHCLKKDPNSFYSVLPREEWSLMNNLFGKNAQRTSVLIDGRYNKYVSKARIGHEMWARKNMTPILSGGRNIKKIAPLYYAMIGLYILILFLIAWNSNDYGDLLRGVFFSALLVCSSLILAYSVNSVIWPKFRFVQWIFVFIGFAGVLALIIYFAWLLMDDRFLPLSKWANWFLILSTLIFIVFAYLIKQPTEARLKLKAYVKGLKMYMNATEKQLLQFENPPEVTPEKFEEFLPYAIALGVEKIWGARFEKQLEKSAITYERNWMQSTTTSSVGMLSSFPKLQRSFSNSAQMPPSSGGSSSSGDYSSSSSSGSSGGGYSGGGHGGGGGRGW